jgi:TolB-like protein
LTTVSAVNPAGALSIVFLPFANLSNHSAQDYFADGITWSLTNDLSRINGLFVISWNTAFHVQGKAVDARQIGKELGVRYILREQSSVTEPVTVTVQLTDSETGREL